MKTKLTYLNEMGIERWELSHPEKLANYHLEPVTPEDSVKLLFVCPQLPEDDQDITLLENIAGSFQVHSDDIRHVYPEKLCQIKFDQVEWIWFCGCEAGIGEEYTPLKVLQSPLLNSMHQNTQLKRQLWQQIQSCLQS